MNKEIKDIFNLNELAEHMSELSAIMTCSHDRVDEETILEYFNQAIKINDGIDNKEQLVDYSKYTDEEINQLASEYSMWTLPKNNHPLWREALKRLDKAILPLLKTRKKK